MIIPVASVIAALLPLFLGGQMLRLGDIRLRGIPVVIGALLVQILILEVLTGPDWLLKIIHVATYVAALYFVGANRRIPGIWVIGLGAASNGLTIAVNGGELPASAHALRLAGLAENGDFANSGVLAHPHLMFLGDVFPIPASWPLSNVFSVGDVLIVGGLAYASLRICGTWWTTAWAAPGPASDGPDVSISQPVVTDAPGRVNPAPGSGPRNNPA